MALRYNIKQAVDKPKGTRVLVPVIQPSPGFERAYLKELRRFLHGASDAIRDIIIPSYQRSPLAATDAQLLGDADSAAFGSFTALVNALSRMVIDRVRELIGLETKRHTEQWLRTAKKTFGVDLKGVVSEEGLEKYLELAGLRNAGLIKGLTDDLIKRVQQDTLDALLNGESVATLKERLKKSLNISDSRASLIAYDQTSKITADLNKQRHKEAGIDEYIWRTAQDERVRERHRKLEGRQYKYGEPTGAEDGLEPGQPIRCRCNAQAVVDFGEVEERPRQRMRAEEIVTPTEVELPGRHKRLTDPDVASVVPKLRDKYSFIDDAPKEQREALHYYLRNNFSKFVEGIRNGSMDPATVDRVRNINELLEKKPLTELPYLYRGLKTPDVNLTSNDPFTSTTLTLKKAGSWAGKEGVVMEIERPDGGFKGFYAERYWNSKKAQQASRADPLSGEQEFLLKGAQYEKLGERTENGLKIVTVRIKP